MGTDQAHEDRRKADFAERHNLDALLPVIEQIKMAVLKMGYEDSAADFKDFDAAAQCLPPHLLPYYQEGYRSGQAEIHPHTRLKAGPMARRQAGGDAHGSV